MHLKHCICTVLAFTLAATIAPCLPSEHGGFMAGGGLIGGVFPGGGGLYPMAGFTLNAGWEFPAGPGAALLNFETGYTAAFTFNGGAFGIMPLALAASYLLPLGASPVSLEGGLRGGAFAVFWEGAPRFTPLVGARLGIEIRQRGGGIWAAYIRGGADVAPEPKGVVMMPLLDVGLRFYAGGNK
jgi:hypothetical protein